jgi:hypothetical protein
MVLAGLRGRNAVDPALDRENLVDLSRIVTRSHSWPASAVALAATHTRVLAGPRLGIGLARAQPKPI